MWWYNWRYLPHMKDEALSPIRRTYGGAAHPDAPAPDVHPRCDGGASSATVCIARRATDRRLGTPGDDSIGRVTRLAPGTRVRRRDCAGQIKVAKRLSTLEKARRFVRRGWAAQSPRSAGRLSPAGVQTLYKVHGENIPILRANEAEASKLEHRLADLVNAGLSVDAG